MPKRSSSARSAQATSQSTTGQVREPHPISLLQTCPDFLFPQFVTALASISDSHRGRRAEQTSGGRRPRRRRGRQRLARGGCLSESSRGDRRPNRRQGRQRIGAEDR